MEIVGVIVVGRDGIATVSSVQQYFCSVAMTDHVLFSRYMMGEEGFCLTSFLTALRYLLNMSAQTS